MLNTISQIEKGAFVSDIVLRDYRTADVFRKYGIEFCCSGKWPLQLVCANKGLELEVVARDLAESMRNVRPNATRASDWSLNFLVDYIIEVHHHYLKSQLPYILINLDKFVEGHSRKFTYLPELQILLQQLSQELSTRLEQEEELVFPYIRQVNRAYESGESYGGLLVKILRKPVEQLLLPELKTVEKLVQAIRMITDNYSFPANACLNHRVTFLQLMELDGELVQHLYLEQAILYPRLIEMEASLRHAVIAQ